MKRTKLSAIPIDIAMALFMEMTFWEILRLALVAQVWKDAVDILWDTILEKKAPCSVVFGRITDDEKCSIWVSEKIETERIDVYPFFDILYKREFYKTIIANYPGINHSLESYQNVHAYNELSISILKDDRPITDNFMAVIDHFYNPVKGKGHSILYFMAVVRNRRIKITDRLKYIFDYVQNGIKCEFELGRMPNQETAEFFINRGICIAEIPRVPYGIEEESYLCAYMNAYYHLFPTYNWTAILLKNRLSGPELYNILVSRQEGLDFVNSRLTLTTAFTEIANAFFPVEDIERLLDDKGCSFIWDSDKRCYYNLTLSSFRQRQAYFKAILKRNYVFTKEMKMSLFDMFGPVGFPWIDEIGMMKLRQYLKCHVRGTYDNEYAIIEEIKKRGEPVDLVEFQAPMISTEDGEEEEEKEEGVDPFKADMISSVSSKNIQFAYIKRILERFPYAAEGFVTHYNASTVPLLMDYYQKNDDIQSYLAAVEPEMITRPAFCMTVYRELLKRGINPRNKKYYVIIASSYTYNLF